MECVCKKDCFGAGGVNKRFDVGDKENFEECPEHFEPVAVAPPPVEAEEEPSTLTELQDEADEAEALARPTDDEINGDNILEE